VTQNTEFIEHGQILEILPRRSWYLLISIARHSAILAALYEKDGLD
jgi:hypothetical protein